MRKLTLNSRLLLVFCMFLAGFLVIQLAFVEDQPLKWRAEMKEAAGLAAEAFTVIGEEKERPSFFNV